MVNGGWVCIHVTGGLVMVSTDSACGSWSAEDGYVIVLPDITVEDLFQ